MSPIDLLPTVLKWRRAVTRGEMIEIHNGIGLVSVSTKARLLFKHPIKEHDLDEVCLLANMVFARCGNSARVSVHDGGFKPSLV